MIQPHVSPGLTFTENQGQWDNHILFRAGLDGGALFLERTKLTFNFYDKKKSRRFHGQTVIQNAPKDDMINGHSFSVVFEGANGMAAIEKTDAGSYYENFFIGEDKSKWKSSVSNYHRVWYRNIYEKIDYEIITAVNGIKYNFHVKPGGNTESIKLKYEGITNLKIKESKLIIKASVNELTEHKPYAFQVINGAVVNVPCNFVLKNNTISYEFPSGYNKDYELVIDPVLVFAAQSGSTADNFGMTATFDPQGNLYSGGTIFNIGYPTTAGAYSASFFGPAYYGNTDVVVTKYNATGNALLYSTYIGGGYTEAINSMIVDGNNNLCFFGVTSSTNFPVSSTAYDNTFNGGSFLMFYYNGLRFVNGTDLYIAKFNSTGTQLLASTYIGGTGNDGLNHTDQYQQSFLVQATPPATGNITIYQPDYDSLMSNYGDQSRGEIQIDNLNNIYVASSTRSSDFPTVNSFDNTLGGTQDGVFIKFNSNLSNLLNSSFLGGSSTDAGYGLIVESNNEAYITGGTASPDFPYATGGYQSTYQGGNADGYVIRIDPAGTSVLNGTYFGTGSYDQSFFIQSDKHKNIYIYGQSLGNIPVVVAPTSTNIFSVANTHQFISRFNPSLTTLNMSTVFGNYTNNFDISPAAFSVDKCSNIYLSGWGANFLIPGLALSNMPLAVPTQSTTDGFDFYFMGLDSNCASLKYGSYFGGNVSQEHVDGGTSRFDPKGKIYQSVCAGCGGNDDFPVSPGAWPCTTPTNCPPGPNLNTNCNNGVIKLDFQLQLAISTINTNTLSGCMPLTITFTNATPGASYVWYLGNGSTTSVIPNPTVTYTTPGNYTVSLVVIDPVTCNKKDSAVNYITVYPLPTSNFSINSSPCNYTVSTINSSSGNLGSNPYVWNWGDATPTSTLTSPSHTYANSGTYTISLNTTDVNGCSAVSIKTLSVLNVTPGIVSSASICEGSAATLTASGGTSYTWSPSAGVGSPNNATTTATPSITTIYSITINNNSNGNNCISTLTTQVTVYPKPVPSFSLTYTPCANTVNVVNSSTVNAGANPYSWYFGDGSATSSLTSPVHTYSANGTFTVSLNLTSVEGCTATSSETLSVLNFAPGVVNSSSICLGYSATLTANGGTSYTWSPSQGLSNPNAGSTQLTPTTTAIYTVEINNNSTGNNCSATLTTQITVFQKPSAAFIASLNPCGGGANYTDFSVQNISSWQWTLSPTATSTVQNPYFFYTSGGTHTVTLIVVNSDGCKDTTQQIISIGTPPPLAINGSSLICEGNSAQLSASGGVSYQWTPTVSLDFANIANPSASPTVNTTYSVVITTTNGCVFLLTTNVNVSQFPGGSVSAIANPAFVITGNSTSLIYLGSPGSSVTWLPFGSTSPTTGYTVSTSPNKPTTYTAVVTNGACIKRTTVFVEAYTEGCIDKDVFLPNTFTPNSDGQNDVYLIRGLKVQEVYFAIYNRWGEMVFETTDKTKGWDGIYKGRPADVGVFGWYLRVKCFNGEETFRKGNVTLIR